MTPEELDPTLVLAFLGVLAAFAAGLELAQVTVKKTTRHKPKLRGALYWFCIIAIIVTGVLIVQNLEAVFP